MTNSDKEYCKIFAEEWRKGLKDNTNDDVIELIYRRYINVSSFVSYREYMGAKSFTDLSIKPGLR